MHGIEDQINENIPQFCTGPINKGDLFGDMFDLDVNTLSPRFVVPIWACERDAIFDKCD